MSLNDLVKTSPNERELRLEEGLIRSELSGFSTKDIAQVVKMYKERLKSGDLSQAETATARRRLAVVRRVLIEIA